MTSTKKPRKTIMLALGNPGAEFENTYHNAGIMALPKVISALTGDDISNLDWKKYKNIFAYAEINPSSYPLSALRYPLVFVRSLTFMNESGIAATEALKKFDVKPEDLIVIHDDSDITLGDYKISFDRSSGGHKGAQSIIDHLKTQTFTRARIGIRPAVAKAMASKPAKESKRQKAGDFVLKKITASGRKILEKVFEDTATAIKVSLVNKDLSQK